MAGINDRGDIVGGIDSRQKELTINGLTRQPFASIGDKRYLIGTGCAMCNATSINELRQVALTAHYQSGYHASFWNRHSDLVDLGTLGGKNSYAEAINSRGLIVGSSTMKDGKLHAFLWKTGAMVPLGTLNVMSSTARAINSHGDVLISVSTPTGQKVILWKNRVPLDLGEGEGRALNDRDQIVGFVNSQATLWQNHKRITLASFYPESQSIASGINNAGQIIGYAVPTRGAANAHATLWQDGRVYDLNTLIDPNSGWELQGAEAINNRGQIVGSGTLQGKPRYFVLTPE